MGYGGTYGDAPFGSEGHENCVLFSNFAPGWAKHNQRSLFLGNDLVLHKPGHSGKISFLSTPADDLTMVASAASRKPRNMRTAFEGNKDEEQTETPAGDAAKTATDSGKKAADSTKKAADKLLGSGARDDEEGSDETEEDKSRGNDVHDDAKKKKGKEDSTGEDDETPSSGDLKAEVANLRKAVKAMAEGAQKESEETMSILKKESETDE